MKRRLGELHRLLKSRKGPSTPLTEYCGQRQGPMTSTMRPYKHWTFRRRNRVDFEGHHGKCHTRARGWKFHCMKRLLEVAEEFERTLKEQVRLQDEPDNSSDALTTATNDLSDCWAAHEATGVKESARPRRETRTWRSTGNEPDVSPTNTPGLNGTSMTELARLGEALQAAARSAHSLTCCVLDRESNETKYLREETEHIEEWQIPTSKLTTNERPSL